ncbi:unnamed protein product [Cyprideis torosa]|uniref:Uncharacterized protein n=1 Tax=Cyprideis torosa TaxID=163714 RepID=A0A7R8W6E7_9CRUS|nr:unnamed protein product [Cyprideis torosa]CAG0884011.1 unnamed protein product [Cyprideis torosa]
MDWIRKVLISFVIFIQSDVNGKIGPNTIGCKNILLLSPICARSHIHMYSAFADGLADRCHNVTLLVSKPGPSSNKNVTQLTDPVFEEVSNELFHFRMNEMPEHSISALFMGIMMFMHKTKSACERYMQVDLVNRMLKSDDHYDLLLVSPHLAEECVLSFVHKYSKIPWAYIFSSTSAPWLEVYMGFPTHYSYHPCAFGSFSDKMDFTERVQNTMLCWWGYLARRYWSEPRVHQVLRDTYDPNIPPLDEIQRTASMVLLNQHSGLWEAPYPQNPDTIMIGGLHARPAKNLPKELKDFADAGPFIFVSFGSAMRAEYMPAKYRKALVEAFRELKEFRILWKWEETDTTDIPSNVKVTKWAPQQDVLGHRNIKVFVTHGGLMSMQEATYHAVPMLGIPIGAEQWYNVRWLTEQMGGLQLKWTELSTDKLVQSIRKLAKDQRYSSAAQERSDILKNQLTSPMERGVFWTEYLIRHNGAPHLRSAGRDLNLFQFYSLDVYSFLLMIVLMLGFFGYYGLRSCYRCAKCVCRKARKKRSKTDKKKTQ